MAIVTGKSYLDIKVVKGHALFCKIQDNSSPKWVA